MLELKEIFFEPRTAYSEFKGFCFPFMGNFCLFPFVTSRLRGLNQEKGIGSILRFFDSILLSLFPPFHLKYRQIADLMSMVLDNFWFLMVFGFFGARQDKRRWRQPVLINTLFPGTLEILKIFVPGVLTFFFLFININIPLFFRGHHGERHRNTQRRFP